MIVRESVKDVIELPRVCLAGLRGFAEYGGFNYGALRTAVTRLKQSGQIKVVDDNGTTRYEMCDFFNYVTRHYKYYKEEDGFTVTVISITKGGEKARYHIQEILKTFGFMRMSRNTFISGKLDISGMMAELKKNGLDENLYLFDCNPVTDPDMLERIKELWDLQGWDKKAQEFKKDLEEFYQLEDLDDAEIFHRTFYVGPAFFKYIQRDFPRLNEKYFPGRRIYHEINKIIHDTSTCYGERLSNYFIKINS